MDDSFRLISTIPAPAIAVPMILEGFGGDREATAIVPHPLHAHLLIIATEDGYISTWDLHQ